MRGRDANPDRSHLMYILVSSVLQSAQRMAGAATARDAYRRALRAAGRSRRGGEIGPPLQAA